MKNSNFFLINFINLFNEFKTFIFIFLLVLTGCTNSNQLVESDESIAIFDALEAVTDTLPNFKGEAFVGNLSGNSRMVLNRRNQDSKDKILRLKYDINNWASGSNDVIDETFLINNLVVKSKDTAIIGLKYTEAYARHFIEGKFIALKSSINDGPIENGSGSGSILFAIDSINRELFYLMEGSGSNYSYQGRVELNDYNHLEVKKVFNDSISYISLIKKYELKEKLEIERKLQKERMLAAKQNKLKVKRQKAEIKAKSWRKATTKIRTFILKDSLNTAPFIYTVKKNFSIEVIPTKQKFIEARLNKSSQTGWILRSHIN